MCDFQTADSPWQGLDLDHARAVAYRQARSIAGNGATREDVRDLQSDLVLAALQRWSRFDPSRGRARAFTAVCISRAAASIYRARSAAKRGGSASTLSLDQMVQTGMESSVGVVDSSRDRDRVRDVDIQHDVSTAIGVLPPDLRMTCQRFLAVVSDPTSSRRTPPLGNVAARLREHFEPLGLKEYLS
jgi:hypothetical protein